MCVPSRTIHVVSIISRTLSSKSGNMPMGLCVCVEAPSCIKLQQFFTIRQNV
jgi:hypothetical protein